MEKKFETKQNSGAIFKNEKKENEKHPDYRGTINWNGKDIEIALWVKESSKGTKYFSASLKEPFKKDAIKPNKNFNDMPF